jgi:hypothetical protein
MICRSRFLSYSIISAFCWNTSHVWGSRKRDEEGNILEVLKAFETSPCRKKYRYSFYLLCYCY